MATSSFGPRVPIAGSERAPLPNATMTGDVDRNERIEVTILVRARASSAAAAEAIAATPAPQRQYVDRAEFAARYGASRADLEVVEKFAREAGLEVVDCDAARRSVVTSGTLGAFENAFGAQLHAFDCDGQKFRGRVGALSVPASLAGIVVGIFGLDNRPQASAQFRRNLRPAASGNTSYTPPQVAQAYDFPAGRDGTGQTVALIELGGGYVQSDLDAYFSALGVKSPKVSSVGVDGGSNAPAGNPSSADGEVMLDIEVVGAIAPGAAIVVYFAPNTDQGFLDAITTAIHDAKNRPSIVSISWGGPESSWTQQALTNFDTAFADAVTLGVSVFAAAGDNGSSDGVADGAAHVDFPASSPHLTACGGTHLTLAGSSRSETVWNSGASGGATGGGISDVFSLPAYQSSAGVPPSANPTKRVGRGVPDVAGDADPATGYQTRVDGSNGVVGGTSAVAPLWAALTALGNQQFGKPLGFLNPGLYANPTAFHDVTSGSNGAYSAKSGWDACTGLGTPDGAKIIAALTGPAKT